MDEKQIANWSNMCRVCFNCYENMCILENNFSEEFNLNYLDLLKTLMGSNFTFDDIKNNLIYPKKLCQNCFKRMITAFSFLQDFKKSEAILQKNIEKFVKIEFVDVHNTHELDDLLIQNTSNITSSIEYLNIESDVSNIISRNETTSSPSSAISHKQQKALKKLPRSLKSPAELICPVCKKISKTPNTFIRHSKTHLKSHICNVCGKNFKRGDSLRTHLRIHSGERPYKASTFCISYILE